MAFDALYIILPVAAAIFGAGGGVFVKNIYDKKKLLDEDFSNRDSEIAKNAKIIKNGIAGTEIMEYQIELQQKIKEQVLDFAFEMYQQGMRDMAKVLR